MTEKSTINETSIGLVGDGDDVDLIEEVETLFDIKLDGAGTEMVTNVGELFDLIIDLGGFENRRTTCCYSQKGFYRLRRRLRLLGLKRKINPQTRVHEILDDLGMTYLELERHLSLDLERTPLPQMPLDRVWLVHCIWIASVFLLIPSVILAADSFPDNSWLSNFGWFLIGAFGFGFFAFYLPARFQTELPLYCETVGGLARVYGAACFDEDDDVLRKASVVDIWDRLCVCLRVENGYGGPIDRQTWFCGEQGEFPAPR